MYRLFCPLWWANFWLDGYRAIQLFIRHDDTLLRVETDIHNGRVEAHGDATNAATLLLTKRPHG